MQYFALGKTQWPMLFQVAVMTHSEKKKTCLSTPEYSHIWSERFNEVYEPSEDTFLLLDALESEIDFLTNLRPSVILEVGIGSGVVLSFVQKIVGTSAVCIGTDINPQAILCAKLTSEKNECSIQIVQDNLSFCYLGDTIVSRRGAGANLIAKASSFHGRLNGLVDVLLFNPPYVVTDSKEVGSQSIQAAWAGGKDGREVIDKFLPSAVDLLSEQGIMYLVTIDRNNPGDIIRSLMTKNVRGKVIASRKAGTENLSILKFRKNKEHSG